MANGSATLFLCVKVKKQLRVLLTILIDLLDDFIQLFSCRVLAQHPHHGTQLLGADVAATVGVEQVEGGFELWRQSIWKELWDLGAEFG